MNIHNEKVVWYKVLGRCVGELIERFVRGLIVLITEVPVLIATIIIIFLIFKNTIMGFAINVYGYILSICQSLILK